MFSELSGLQFYETFGLLRSCPIVKTFTIFYGKNTHKKLKVEFKVIVLYLEQNKLTPAYKVCLITNPLSLEICELCMSKMHIAHSQEVTHRANYNFI